MMRYIFTSLVALLFITSATAQNTQQKGQKEEIIKTG